VYAVLNGGGFVFFPHFLTFPCRAPALTFTFVAADRRSAPGGGSVSVRDEGEGGGHNGDEGLLRIFGQ